MRAPIANRISHGDLLDLVSYDFQTGVFKNRKARGSHGRLPAGKILGTGERRGYIRININGTLYLAHRLAWFYSRAEWPQGEIDHINHDRTDNRIANLRVVTTQGNRRNSSPGGRNTSGLVGVRWEYSRKAWEPRIKVDGQTIHLGRTSDFFEAACRRKSAECRFSFHPNHGKCAATLAEQMRTGQAA